MHNESQDIAAPSSSTWLPRRRTALGLGALAVSLTGLAACGGSGGASSVDPSEKRALALPTYVAPEVPEGGIVSEVEGMPTIFVQPVAEEDYFQSVDEAPGDGETELTSFQYLWGSPPRSRGDNPSWQEFEKQMGVTWNPILTAVEGYDDKVSTTVASGDIPDLMFVDPSTPSGLSSMQDGAFADLSEVLAGDNVLQWPNLANIPEGAWKATALNGHLLGIPNENPYLNNLPVFRKDLVELAGHEDLGSNADEFLQVLIDIGALKTAHGKQIWAIPALTRDYHKIFEWVYRAGTNWQLDDSGSVINVRQTEGFAKALEAEATLWKEGAIHPDAFSGGLDELWGNGQTAVWSGSFGGIFGVGLDNLLASTPEAEVEWMIPPAFDGGDLLVDRDDGAWGIVAISSAAAEDEQRLHTLLDIVNWWRAPYGSKEALFIKNGIEGVHFEFDEDSNIITLDDEQAGVDHSALNWLGVSHSPTYTVPARQAEHADGFRIAQETYISLAEPSAVLGMMAPSASRLNAKLEQIDDDYRNAIVTGRKGLDAIEEYRTAWLDGGGQTLIDEYDELLAENS
ncbi:MAG: extracellular solute-binding protein [Actinomycetales bacterium]|nr:extracellular solute-binding protein [Actinomycetales bacterium]